MSYKSETAKYRHLTEQYCYVSRFTEESNGDMNYDTVPGCGIDIASQGDPVVPWAWQLELPEKEFSDYTSGFELPGPIQIRGYAQDLSFISTGSLDFVYSSHLLEDFEDWMPLLKEWTRVLKRGGFLIVLMPDKTRWAEALAKGQIPNCAHRHECQGPDEILAYAKPLDLDVVECAYTDVTPDDYSVLFVGKKR